ncbi:protein polybromo-1-like isoform X2 [Anneissia japonica]|uniref:protein polybromo-1-like isoform X2 n=1 Tax=Anneissia japonica TaxID=1529436 RepID=UPI001425933B|nr:protein polybromo-1-like isoform X2 [Anneissia japonica]
MSKRRRSTTSVNEEMSEVSNVTPVSITIKKRKRSIQTMDVIDICHELYETIRNQKDENGRLVCEAFHRAPKRRSQPDYYEVVSSPIDMLKIQQRIRMDEYDTVNQMSSDVELMISNAKSYYVKTSQEYKDACDLWDLFVDRLNEMMQQDGPSGLKKTAQKEAESYERRRTRSSSLMEVAQQQEKPAPVEEDAIESSDEEVEDEGDVIEDDQEDNNDNDDEDYDAGQSETTSVQGSDFAMENPDSLLEQLFTAVIMHRDTTGRYVSALFRKLPKPAQFPDYYEVIDHPIDMKDMAKKIRSGKYTCLNQLVDDMNLMVRNAKTFNEPGSQVYKDACTLKKVIMSKAKELERRKELMGVETKTKSSERIKKRRSNFNQEAEDQEQPENTSAIDMALDLPSDGEEEPESSYTPMQYEEGDEWDSESFLMDSNDALHVLFDVIVKQKNAAGHLISEPFYRLPSRRHYPDYYEEIKNPMALGKIRAKLKSGKYDSLEDLGHEMDLVFGNAKQYNKSTSRLYKDADKLQRLLHIKKRELQKLDMKRELEDDEGFVKKQRLFKREEGDGDDRDIMKQRMLQICDKLAKYQNELGRFPIELFVEKPSKKLYPDYYQVITEPIDLTTIRNDIEAEKYSSEEAVLDSFQLMFNNARLYNEEGSLVYQDANLLETILKKYYRELGPLPGKPKYGSPKKASLANLPKGPAPLSQKLSSLYAVIRDYRDSAQRELAVPFIRLPSKNEYPEYYQVIKKPIDMQRIQQRMNSKQYETIDDMVNDFLLLFDNACKFNEPDSWIYKDALTLQRELLRARRELTGNEVSGVPEVMGMVREILTSLFVSVANHQDEEGRCYSDSLAEIPMEKKEGEETVEKPAQEEQDPPAETKESVPSSLDLDTLRKFLDRGCFRRLDRFQDGVFEIFEQARKLSRTDSQLYEDVVELQKFFITIRDEICKNGEILLSPALSYTHRHLQNALDKEKKEKLPNELKEDAEKREEDDGEQGEDGEVVKAGEEGDPEGLVVQGQTYKVGDFIYVEPSEKNLKPHIVCINRVWRDDDGENWLHGNWYLRPNETFHLATRKFLEKEVFKSDYYNKVKFNKVVGRCFVMFVKDYFKNKPEGFPEADIYVCESRYSAKAKAFKKIKIWSQTAVNSKLIPRTDIPSKVRVASVFANQVSNEKKDDEDEVVTVFEKIRETVECEVLNTEEGCKYYEQMRFEGIWYKLGDHVFLRSDQLRPFIARIDKMWLDANEDPWFHGPWFVHPSETEHPPTRMFYKNEVFLSSIEDTNPMRSISGKCAVLGHKDYISCRPTEIAEEHVFICESQYKEAEKQIRKIKHLKRFTSLSNKVIDDEIYFFKKPITPLKEPSPLLKAQEDEEEEDNDDGEIEDGESHMGESDTGVDSESITSTPRAKTKSRHASGFILFASENRPGVRIANPKWSFGEISRDIGLKWRNLTPEQKATYEERASEWAEARAAEKEANIPLPSAGSVCIYECLWEGCDHQYEDRMDLQTHTIELSGHIKNTGENGEKQFACKWKNCPRYKKNQPFPVMGRLIRHCKEVHIRHAAKYVFPSQIGRNYFSCESVQNGLNNIPPGQNAVMGIVGPPTPVGMAARQIYPSLNPALQGQMQGYPQQGMTAQWHQTPGGQWQQQMPQQQQPGQFMSPGQVPQQYPMNMMPQGMVPQPGQMMPQGMMPYDQSPMMMPPHPHPGHPPPLLHHPPPPPPQMLGPQPVQPQQQQQPYQGVPMNQANVQPQAPPQPLFVAPPPKTQRLLHSEAYIRYIEGLTPQKTSVGDWERNLYIRPEHLPPVSDQRVRNVGQWLENKPADGDITKALWKLRDYMLNDALRIDRAYEFEEDEPKHRDDDIIIEVQR